MTPHRGFAYVHITYPYTMFKPFSTEDSLTLPDLNFLDLGGDDPLLPSHSFEIPELIFTISNESEHSRRNFV